MKKTAIKKLLVEKKIIIEIGITQLNSEKDCEVRKKVQPYWCSIVELKKPQSEIGMYEISIWHNQPILPNLEVNSGHLQSALENTS